MSAFHAAEPEVIKQVYILSFVFLLKKCVKWSLHYLKGCWNNILFCQYPPVPLQWPQVSHHVRCHTTFFFCSDNLMQPQIEPVSVGEFVISFYGSNTIQSNHVTCFMLWENMIWTCNDDHFHPSIELAL